MWIKINEKRFLNMDNFLDVTQGKKTIYLQGTQPNMYLSFIFDSPEAKAILTFLEEQEDRPPNKGIEAPQGVVVTEGGKSLEPCEPNSKPGNDLYGKKSKEVFSD